MIKGIDISNHNFPYLSSINFSPLYDDSKFTIIKASEGLTYKDRFLDFYYNLVHGSADGKPDKKRLYGFYHYARPDNGNKASHEAYNFLRLVKHHAGHAIYALDVEGAALNLDREYLDRWVLEWCQTVYAYTHVKPMIYCSASATNRFNSAAEFDCGLWVASWGKKPTKSMIKPWDFYAIWQDGTSGGRLDTDQFNGSAEQWRAYGSIH